MLAIPPLVQCVDDSLRWFGETDLSAVQVTATHISPRQQIYLHRLVSVLNWFNIGTALQRAHAVVTVSADRWDERRVAAVVAAIQQTNTGSFKIGSLVSVPAEYAAGPDWGWLELSHVDTGVAVSMPEWSPATVGWVIARLFDAILSSEPKPRHLSVRVTRLEEAL